ncbi:N-acyl homoserine lactonase family protein [Actinomycetospora straminea]|uniref:N-acyl homoserine lactonase family protein n=1 Tax=Actinomycetospora straminea TaxID=663607 RepID=A0ABP9EE30_9PSEU|nr:N-acyl homoserine lactonase family protein [Actinomycetospora straminea]MDD7932196.1 N-acyl homoserine lactonase family protein [Actinomycetospora straminea]
MTRGCARRLVALDGARLTLDRADMLDGAAPGPVELVVPTFLVEHDDGLVLVDGGLAPEAADDPVATYGAELGAEVRMTPDQRLDRQLSRAGVSPGDVTHVVITHVHFDHTGGLRHVPHARFLLGAGDRGAVDGSDPAVADLARTADLAPVRDADWTFVEGDHDLFGDGAVVVVAMPGHTPGNTSVLVRLPSGPLLLSGDTAHLHEALKRPAPMAADTDREQALASLHRLIGLAATHGADVWVTHDPDDWARLAPAFSAGFSAGRGSGSA